MKVDHKFDITAKYYGGTDEADDTAFATLFELGKRDDITTHSGVVLDPGIRFCFTVNQDLVPALLHALIDSGWEIIRVDKGEVDE